MVQWRGEWHGDLFQMRAGDVLDAMGSNIAKHSAEEMGQASEVVLYVVPTGGFRSPRHWTPKGSIGVGVKAIAAPLITPFEKAGAPIERRVQQ